MNFDATISPSLLVLLIGLFGFIFFCLVVGCLQGLGRKLAVFSAIDDFLLLLASVGFHGVVYYLVFSTLIDNSSYDSPKKRLISTYSSSSLVDQQKEKGWHLSGIKSDPVGLWGKFMLGMAFDRASSIVPRHTELRPVD